MVEKQEPTDPATPSPVKMISPGSSRIALIVVIALYVVLGVAYSVAFPIFESWDEVHHYDYVRYLTEERRLPVQRPGDPESHYFQPPAYYLITALLTSYLPADPYRPAENPAFAQPYWYEHNKNRYIHPQHIEGWPWHGTALNAHVMRLLSVGWGAMTLVLTYHLAGRLLPGEPGGEWLRVGAVALTAFNPSFLYLMSSINSMVIAVVIGAALMLILADTAIQGLTLRRALAAGLLMGLAALIRWTMAPFLGVFIGAVAVSVAAWRSPKQAALRAIVALLVMAVVAGWWYIRSTLVYGDPLAMWVLYNTWGEGRPPDAPPFFSSIPLLMTSYWGSFGPWGSIRLPAWVYWVFIVFTLAGIAGIAWRWLAGALSANAKRVIFVLGSVCVGFFVTALIAGSQSRFGVQQRWLMPAHAAAMVLLAVGWWQIIRVRCAPDWVRISCAALPFLLAVSSLVWFIYPAYAQPRTVDDPMLLAYDTPLSMAVQDFTTLIGASVPEHAAPGEIAWVRLCWQTARTPEKDYWLFAHVVGTGQDRLAGIDSLPGKGNYPTTDWQPGTSHCTDWPIEIPPDALPGRYTVQVGLYQRETLHRLKAVYPDGAPFDPPVVGTLVIDAQPGPLPAGVAAVDVDFGEVIRLRGASVVPSNPEPGNAVQVTLYWEALSPPGQSYTVFVHLTPRGQAGGPLVQADGVPRMGLYPTDLWPVGGLVPDAHTLFLPDDLAPGEYEIRIGLYDPATGARLPSPEPDSAFSLPLGVIPD